ncbi:hypothetical protein [Streptomyces sp. NPDC003006]
MRRHVQFTEQAGRFRDHIPPGDREKLLRIVDRIVADPEGPGTDLANIADSITRSVCEDHVMVEYVATTYAVIIVEVDIYDHTRGYNDF